MYDVIMMSKWAISIGRFRNSLSEEHMNENLQRAPWSAFDENGISGLFDSDRYFSLDSPTIARPDIKTSTPIMRGKFSNFIPRGNLEDNLRGSFSLDDETFLFFRVRRPGQYDSSTDSKQAAVGPEVEIVMGSQPLKSMSRAVYVDDCNISEHLYIAGGTQHITTKKTIVKIHAAGSQQVFEDIE